MQQISEAFVVYAWQVTAVVLFGLLASWVTLRIRPTLAPSLACATLAVIVAFSLAAPFPVPTWLVRVRATPGVQPTLDVTEIEPLRASQSTGGIRQADPTSSLEAPMRFNLSWLTQRFERLAVQGPAQAVPRSWAPHFFVIAVILSCIGGIRLAGAILYAHRVHRKSQPIDDKRVVELLSSLVERICPGRNVRVRETELTASAAVLGCFRPTILLPRDWPSWSRAELQSVIAHETAHIARYDSLWRAISCVVLAIHYCNPLVHILARRVALTHEITADGIASQVVGQNEYIRALSRLALNQNDKEVLFSHAGPYPVFSGYLIRRIKMLKTRPDRIRSDERVAAKVCGALATVAVGALIFAARGSAQTTEVHSRTDDMPAARVARVEHVQPKNRLEPTKGMFQRALTDPALIPENKLGMIKVRMADLCRQPGMAPVEMLINRLSAEALKSDFKSSELPTFNLSAIDLFYGTSVLSTVHRPDLEGTRKNSLQFGVGDAFIRFREQADASAWLARYVPTAQETRHEGRSYFTLPVIPALGPVPMAVANRDAQTVCVNNGRVLGHQDSDSSSPLASLMSAVAYQEKPNRSSWANAFRRVDGGLFAYAVTNEEIRTPDSFEWIDQEDGPDRAMAEALHRIEHTFETLALGVDVAEDGNRIGLRFRIGCSQRSDTEAILADVRALRRMGLRSLDAADEAVNSGAEEDQLTRIGLRLTAQFMEKMAIDLVEHADGSSDVYVRTVMAYPSVLELLAQSVLGDFNSVRDSEPSH